MARALSICLGMLLCFGGVARADKPRIAVLGLEVARGPTGATDPGAQLVAREVTRELRQRVQAPASPYVLAPNSSKELLDEKLLMSCETESPECMVVIGAGLASDVVLYGRVDRKGEGFRISLKLLDVKRKLVHPAADELPGSGGGIPGVARRLYRKLIADAPSGEGALVIRTRSDAGGAIVGGTVFIDGDPRGQLIGGKLTVPGIGEGRHTVAISVGGHRRFEEIVAVRGGEQTTLDALLHQQPAAPVAAEGGPAAPSEAAPASGPSPLWKVSLIAGAAAVVGGGTLAWYSYDRQQAQVPHFRAKVSNDRCGDSDASLMAGFPQIDLFAFRRACSWYTRTYIGYGIAAAGAAAAVVSLIMLSRDPPRRESPATGARGRKAQVAVVPVITPDLAGAQLSLAW